ncbi:MAG: hypothetical protein CSA62_12065 [Planctomycetota bacterium]|nr:MAG: hypothetical protein CSA62_12065 [Planctomycetota bacterium]
MKIALVSHGFPPDSNAGTEIVTLRLAQSLLAQGHEVLVHTTRKDLTRKDGSIVRGDYEGVPVQRVIRNLFHTSFHTTYEDALCERVFEREVLERFAPDLLHIHHLIHHSAGLAELAKGRGLPVVMTLHDYWLECPRFGHLRGWDEEICFEVDFERCSRCLQAFSWRQPRKLRWVAGALRLLRILTRLDLQRPFQRLWRRLSTARDLRLEGERHLTPALEPRYVTELEERRRVLFQRLLPNVDRFLCPSDFLRQRMLALGLPESKTQTQLFGVPRPGPGWPGRRPAALPRFAYVGAVMPHKGVEILVAAFDLLQQRLGPGRIQLSIHGGWASDPSYGERVRDLALECGARVTGAFLPEQIEEILSEVDVLVVPSLWFENSPVTMHDARVRGIPVLCSDLGAMSELVPEPERRFRAGDPEDLARAMCAILEGDAGPSRCPLPPSPEEALEKLLQLYRELCR